MSARLPRLLLLVQVAATLFMVGVVWFVQIVHYPLFGLVGEATFAAYESAHTRLTFCVVVVPMLLEACTAVMLFWQKPARVSFVWLGVGLGLLGVIWLATTLFQVPQHFQLTLGYHAAAHHLLVASNWLRTAAWSLRGCLVLWFLVLELKLS